MLELPNQRGRHRKVGYGRTVIAKRPNPRAAFLNIPYDEQFADLYLAYIAALTAHGMTPRATLELPGGAVSTGSSN